LLGLAVVGIDQIRADGRSTVRHESTLLNQLARSALVVALWAWCYVAHGAALDDVRIEIGPEQCPGFAAEDRSLIVHAENTNTSRIIAVTFKYDSVPARQHFILFDAGFNPNSDRFPKSMVRRLAPLETAAIGCSATKRTAPGIHESQNVALQIAKDSAVYIDGGETEPRSPDARAYLAFYLQNDGSGCATTGSKPPGLFYAVNLHPFARLSGSLDLLDDRGNKVDVVALDLAPLSSAKVGCSNGLRRPGGVGNVTLATSAGAAPARAVPVPEREKIEAPAPHDESLPSPLAVTSAPPLPLMNVQPTQNVCAGPVPSGWIKVNDSWSPTVCGKPTSIIYNVWSVQALSAQPIGALIYACSSSPPPGWVLVSQMWNPTVCGHPSAQQPNQMAIKRLE
jgi:hypothetical protein